MSCIGSIPQASRFEGGKRPCNKQAKGSHNVLRRSLVDVPVPRRTGAAGVGTRWMPSLAVGLARGGHANSALSPTDQERVDRNAMSSITMPAKQTAPGTWPAQGASGPQAGRSE